MLDEAAVSIRPYVAEDLSSSWKYRPYVSPMLIV
jgi:hypothetical protein